MATQRIRRVRVDAHREHLLEEELREARRRLAAVESLRRAQADAAEFLAAIEDHARASVLLSSAADLRAALR